MRIASCKDRRLRRLMTDNDRHGLPPATVEKLLHMLTYLSLMRTESELETLKAWRAHRLVGDLAGHWSLTVTRNWRLIFHVESDAIYDLDLIDYH